MIATANLERSEECRKLWQEAQELTLIFSKIIISSKSKNKMKKAFTMVEILVALGVFAIGVLGIFVFFATSAQIGRLASNTSIATNLASGIIEEEFSKSYDELNPGTGDRTHISPDQSNPFYKFEKQETVTWIDIDLNTSATDEGLKKIEIFVYWKENGKEKNVQVSTIKTER